MDRILHPYLLLSLAVLFWAGNSVVGRAFADEISPLSMVFWRWVIACVILTPLCLKKFIRDWPVLKQHMGYVFLQGFLSITVFNALLYWGLHYTTVINTALIQAAMPVLTLIFSLILLKKGVSKLGIVGIALSMSGVVYVVLQGDLASLKTLEINRGDLLILACMTLWAIYTVLLAKAPQGISRLGLAYGLVLCGLILLVPLYGYDVIQGARVDVTGETLLAFAYIGVFPSVLSILCWNKGVEMVGANVAGIFLNLMPIFGTVLGIILLGERLQGFHMIGIAFIFCGIWLVTRPLKVRAPQ